MILNILILKENNFEYILLLKENNFEYIDR